MKKLILLALMSAFAMSGGFTYSTVDAEAENKRLCKVYIKKAHNYKDTMRSDKLAQATLDSYKDRVVSHCGAVAAKKPMNPFAAKLVLKNVEAQMENVELCKASIEAANVAMKKDEATFDSYKKDVVANCGTISAKV